MYALEVKKLSKSYGGVPAIQSVDLSVPRGEFFGLLGQNGAGKTTLIHCVTGIATFTEGTITVLGNDVQKDYQKTRAAIGLSPQEFNADIFATVEQTLHYVGGYFGMRKANRETRMNELLSMLDLQDHRKKPFGKLSGGLKRRAILARALMHSPDVLILDEPTAGIDVEQRHALWKYLKDLHAGGKTIILTSHYLEEVEQLCSRVAIMHAGHIIKELSRDEYGTHGSLEQTYLSLTKASV